VTVLPLYTFKIHFSTFCIYKKENYDRVC
jgi:hypothetical protein